jgi:CHAD domain-containing protein
MPRQSSAVSLLHAPLATLLKAMPRATSGDAGSVHRARVASRRLRAALPVIATIADDAAIERAGKQVRKITRALGPVREIDVALQHLDEFAPRAELSPRATTAVRKALVAFRQKRRREMLQAITPAALHKLKRRLDEAAREPAVVLDSPLEIGRVAEQAALRAAALDRAIEHAGSLYLPDRLHAVRVAAKKLRYTLELERDLRRSRAVARIRDLKGLQDRLGYLHDLEVLIEHVRGVQAELAPLDRVTALELDRLIRTLEDQCREGHAAYMHERAHFTQMCARIHEAAQAGRPTVAA